MRAPYVDRTPRFQLTIKVREASFDSEKVIKLLEKGNYEALRKIGLDLKEQAKRSIGQAAPARTKAGNKAAGAKAVVAYKQGLYRDMTIVSGGKPRPPGSPVKSWSPRRWMYNDIADYYDAASKSAVVGVYRSPWLNQLHEFGGSLNLTMYRVGVGEARRAYASKKGKKARDRAGSNGYVMGAVIWNHKAIQSRHWERTDTTKNARYPARPFMQHSPAMQKKLAKVHEKFKDALKG